MSTSDLIKMAIKNLWKRKLRTFLTILGVVIGTASIVVMVSIGIGMNKSLEETLQEWGNLTVINVGTDGRYDYYEEETTTQQNTPKKEVVLNSAAIEEFEQIPGVEAATPVLNEYLTFVCGKYVADTRVQGINPNTMEIMGYEVEKGRVLQEGDENTAVFGGFLAQDFYNPKSRSYSTEPPEIDVMEDKIALTYDNNYGTRDEDRTIRPVKIDVVGVTSEDGADSYSVFMPIKQVEEIQKQREDYRKKQSGNEMRNSSSKKRKGVYEEALVKVEDMEQVKEVQQKIKDMGFSAYSLTQDLERMKETTKMMRMMLGAIGAISLVVAAIGITNTMVMAIYERTREIGVMKVIGASLMDIKKLFLTEAAFIGFIGGVFGVLISLGASKGVNYIATQQNSDMLSVIPIWLCFASLCFATFIGVAAGYFPANRAMKLSALSAIKTE